jgi:DNA-directed RNA polymerase specialized sigma24 family protein
MAGAPKDRREAGGATSRGAGRRAASGKPAGGTAGGGSGGPGGSGKVTGKRTPSGRARPETDAEDDRAKQLAAPLRQVLQRLPATQRKVLELRMGLVDGHPQDPADAARTLGISLGELREIEARAFERIREVIPLQQLQRFLER